MRDDHLIESLEMEEQAAYLDKLVTVTGQIAAGAKLDADGRKGLLKDMLGKCSEARTLSGLDVHKYLEDTSSLAPEEIYDLLSGAGYLGHGRGK
jgi:hypothetical protein